jgi:hypothetical protein
VSSSAPGPVATDDRDDHPTAAHRPLLSRGRLLGVAAAVLVLALVAVGVVVATRGERSSSVVGTQPTGSPGGHWLSGASGPEAVNGAFASWRGRPVDIVGTWADDDKNMVGLWNLRQGGDIAPWRGPLDIAIGAISADESWSAAAKGAYDARWRESLTNLRDLRKGTTGPTYIRFAHESNGNWYPWAVDESEVGDFVSAWRHFRSLQQEIFPASKLVFDVNRESIGSGFDWRKSFPGASYVDVVGVDYYNNGNPTVNTAADWQGSLDDVDDHGAPKGLGQYAAFAKSVGLPLAIPEWSGNASKADSPAFIQGMHDYVSSHAGTGPGQVLYEIVFNVPGYDGQFVLHGPGVLMPQSAAAYQRLW